MPTLWYRIDESDNDVASFFYYFGQAANTLKRRRVPLPHYSPACHESLAVFTRHYVDSFFGRIRSPLAIVFDNYQDVPEPRPSRRYEKTALTMQPDYARGFIISRTGFPAQFSVLEAEGAVATVGWEDIRFNLDEVREIVEARKGGALREEVLQSLHRESLGWISAIVMMLADRHVVTVEPGSIGRSSVFNYFALEVFHRFDDRLREFLLKSAVLTTISPGVAGALTGIGEGDACLAYLYRNHYFTDRYDGGAYRFHPLFREFLLDRAEKTYGADEMTRLSAAAGRLLAGEGHVEEAIRLLLEARAYGEALDLLLGHAQGLLRIGRFATLREWTDMIPEEVKRGQPRIFYWLGVGCLTTDPPSARAYLEAAFALSETASDREGCLLAAAAIMNSIMLEWNDYHPLDRWIEWIDRHVDPEAPLSPPEIEAQVAAAMVCGLTWRAPWHANMGTWIDRALDASRRVQDAELRMMARGTVMEYYTQFGHFAEMYDLAGEFRRLTLSPEAPPQVQLAFIIRAVELHDWINGSWEKTIDYIRKAIDLATELGSQFHLGAIYVDAALAAFETNNLDMAEVFLSRMEALDFSDKRAIDSRFHGLRVFYHLAKSNPAAALRSARNAVQETLGTGIYVAEARARTCLAYALR
jgi:ATP/maltotriose-dependent transcriptional regulator MalT